jgi:hypothetical protein
VPQLSGTDNPPSMPDSPRSADTASSGKCEPRGRSTLSPSTADPNRVLRLGGNHSPPGTPHRKAIRGTISLNCRFRLPGQLTPAAKGGPTSVAAVNLLRASPPRLRGQRVPQLAEADGNPAVRPRLLHGHRLRIVHPIGRPSLKVPSTTFGPTQRQARRLKPQRVAEKAPHAVYLSHIPHRTVIKPIEP